jgi:hypothetical protein
MNCYNCEIYGDVLKKRIVKKKIKKKCTFGYFDEQNLVKLLIMLLRANLLRLRRSFTVEILPRWIDGLHSY